MNHFLNKIKEKRYNPSKTLYIRKKANKTVRIMNKNVSWVIKYHPTNLNDFIGNQTQIEKLKEWINDFKNKTENYNPIAYIYGNTGIGKTTISYLILKLYGYDVFELNSSEIRSKKRMEDIFEKILGHRSINLIKKNKKKSQQQTGVALLMDETDGMSCGDKGGLHYLFEIIEQTKKNIANGGTPIMNPIICVGTKPYDKKNITSIMTEFYFEDPSMDEIRTYCKNIIDREGIYMEDSVLEHVIDFCRYDIRKIILMLQELRDYFPDSPILYDHIEYVTSLFEEKEIDNDLFNVTEELYSTHLPSSKIYHYYQLEPNLIPMMLYENLPDQFEKKKITNGDLTVQYQKIMDYLIIGDLIENTALSHNELSYHCSILKCETLNNMINGYIPKNVKKTKKIKFTGSLSKSALISNNNTFITSFTLNHNISYYYLPFFFEYIYLAISEISKNDKVIHNLKINLRLTPVDYEKILQFCQKWFNISALSVVKMKRDIKKFLLKDTSIDYI